MKRQRLDARWFNPRNGELGDVGNGRVEGGRIVTFTAPDEWERQHNLDPRKPADRNDESHDGCTRIEQYLNSLIPGRS